jgi:hypothetical protein
MTKSAATPPSPARVPEEQERAGSLETRPIPPMLVAKRWWRKLERVPLEVLEAEDRAREAAEKARQEARRRR